MIASFRGFSLWERPGDWDHKWMSEGRESPRGRLQLAMIMEMGCESLHSPKPPGDLHSTRKIDETDINYLWLSSSVMLWNSLLLMFLVFFFPLCDNTCQRMCFNIQIFTHTHTHTCRYTNPYMETSCALICKHARIKDHTHTALHTQTSSHTI